MALLNDLTNNSLTTTARKVGSSATDSLSSLVPGSSGLTGSTGVGRGQYEFDKYDIKSLTYPMDLLGNAVSLTSKNYVIFYINVSVDSKVLKEKKEEVVTGVTRGMRGDLVGQRITEGQAQFAAGVQAAVGGSAAGKLFGNNTVLGAAAGVAVGATAVAIVSPSSGDAAPGETKEAEFTRPQKRLKKAIALYIPNRLEVNYGVNYTEEETAMFQAIAKGGQEVSNAIKNKGDAASLKQAGGVAGDVLNALALAATDKAVGIGAGRAVNPKKEQAFQGVNFRTFSFSYTFAPRSLAEAEIVKRIIYEFKYHMHPEFLNPSAFTYVYPSEFDIVYYNGPNENQYLHKHTSCVLESMSVDYTPNALFSTFDNGMPTQINVTLTFKELLAATKETIEKGL